MSSSLTVTFRNTDSTAKNTTIIVKDYLTEAVIKSASVVISGPGGYSKTGATDNDGKLVLGTIQPGEYTLVVTAAGYQNSATDILANDKFTI